MQTSEIFREDIHTVQIVTNSTGGTQVEFQSGITPYWVLSIDNAERLSVQILTDSREALVLDRVLRELGHDDTAGSLLVVKQEDKWVLAHSTRHPQGDIWLKFDFSQYQKYFKKYPLDKSKLPPELETMKTWELKTQDAQRMALAVLEGIGRQSWIPAFRLARDRPKEKVNGLRDLVAGFLEMFVVAPLICIAIAVVVLIILYAVRGMPPSYSSTDILLIAILIAMSVTFSILIQIRDFLREV